MEGIQKLIDARGVAIRVARRKTGRSDVEDIVQDAYYRVFKNIDRVDTSGNMAGYLAKTTHNCAINNFRKEESRGLNFRKKVDLEEIYNLPQEEGLHGMSDEVFIALKNLSTKMYQGVMLQYVMGYSQEEVAEIMDIPMGTVKSNNFRALKILKEQLTPFKNQLDI